MRVSPRKNRNDGGAGAVSGGSHVGAVSGGGDGVAGGSAGDAVVSGGGDGAVVHGSGVRSGSGHVRQGRWFTPYLYILPAFLVYGAFMLYPLARAVHLSLFDWDGLTLATFVGFGNYADILADDRLRAAFAHALVFIFFFAVLPVCVGLVLAAVLTRAKVRGLPMFRTIVFLPQVIAMVVVAVAWRGIYAPDGLLNSGLRAVGLDVLVRSWLGDYALSLPAVGLIGSWVCTGLVTVLLMAGMAKIPTEHFEAVRLDGAGVVREFFTVIVPAVRAEVTVALTLTIVASLKTFDLIYMTTRGGPGSSTTVPSYEVYRRAFETGQVGSAAAVGVTLTVLIFLISLLVNRMGERETS